MTFSLVACGGPKTPNDPDDPNKPSDPADILNTEYTITFDVGSEAREAGIKDPDPQTVKYGKSFTLPVLKWGEKEVIWKNGDTVCTGSEFVTSDMTITAEWIELTQYDKDINSGAKEWVQAGHLYIHYKRGDHVESEENKLKNTKAKAPDFSGDNKAGDNYQIESASYKNWGAWVWPTENANGKLFNASFIDESGAVYDILLDNDYTKAGWDGSAKVPQNVTINFKDSTEIGFQIHQIDSRTGGSGFWVNDGGDNFISLANAKRDSNGSYHWYVTENAVNVGTPFDTGVKIDNPYKDDTPKKDRYVSKTNIDSTKDNKSQFPHYKDIAVDMDDTAVGYQIFIASFCDSDNDGRGDLQGVISKLDYLDKLNVDILWLTPFQQSTGYHGYDISDYYSVDPKFGTIADFRQLVYEAHKRGMKIVMDYVLNHTSLSNAWFQKSSNLVTETVNGKTINYRNFYNWISEEQYQTALANDANIKKQWFKDKNGYYFFSSFNSSQPELNYDYQPVRDAIIDVAKYWMEFGLDGFRLDAVKHIYMKNEIEPTGRTWSGEKGANSAYYTKDTDYLGNDGAYSQDIERNLNFYHEFNSRLKEAYPNAFVVGENLTGNPAGLAPYFEGMDSQFNFNLYYDVSRAVARSANSTLCTGYNLSDAITAWKKCYDGTGWPAMQAANLGFSKINSNYIDGAFTSNHDLPRARDRLNISGSGENDDKYSETFFTDNTTYTFLDKTTKSCKSVDGKTVNTANVTKTDVLLRLYYAFQMMVPGVSWIYYGDEIGMSGLMQYSVASSTSTSSTDSQPHEDIVYRQPMKWHAQTSKGTKDNASFKIGYGDIMCELQGLNATKYVASVDEQDIKETNETNPKTLLNWMRLLTKIRNDYGLAKANVVFNNYKKQDTTMDFTLTSKGKNTKGKKIRVQMRAASSSALSSSGSLAYYDGVINGKHYSVCITKG